MNTIFRAFAIQCVLVAGAHAGHHRQVVIIPQGFIAVPFAVPVAVPSYVQYQAIVASSPLPEVSAATATQEATAKAHEAPPPTLSLVAKSCVKCHSGEKPKGKLDLSGDLSPALRLKAIGRILADDESKRMPKGKPLDAQAIGLLIQELSRVPVQKP